MKVALTLETVTPLFLGGGGVTQQSELRPASFRGALRYWYRALVGGVIGSDLNALRQAESKVFGNTEGISPVTLRLRGAMRLMSTFDLDRDGRNAIRNGHNYFFYSTRLGNNRREPFAPPQSSSEAGVILTFSTHPGAYQGDISMQHACAAAWLLTHLGGLGTRSRRCAGSLQVLQGASPNLPNFAVTAQNAVELQGLLESGLRQIRTFIGTSHAPSLDFDVLHPDVCRVWVLTGDTQWETWKEAVDAMGSRMQTFRAMQGTNRNTLNSIFGVPILHGPNHSLQREFHSRKARGWRWICLDRKVRSNIPNLPGGDIPMSHLLAFHLGPVQDFIATARRTQDWWMGSWLLSHLSRKAIDIAQYKGATLVLPKAVQAPKDPAIADTPNHFLARIEAANPAEVGRAVEAGVRSEWLLIHRKVKTDLFDCVADDLWTRQLETFLEIYWAIVRDDGAKEARNDASDNSMIPKGL